jgi:hypothetical protein
MREATGNLWTHPADVRVITTNGFVKKNGQAVMGRGCALEAVKGTRYNGAWPGLPSILGAIIQSDGNHVSFLGACVTPATGILVSFPVKHLWMQKADIDLIKRSAEELARGIAHDGSRIVMPRPGCGNGRLKWEDVKPIIEGILPDNVVVITF